MSQATTEERSAAAQRATPARGRAGRLVGRAAGVAITLATVAVAGFLGWRMWTVYMAAPWTRDGRVRVNVVRIAPEVSGQITLLPIADNQFVHKGDLLMRIDQRDYAVALATAAARMDQARTDMQNKQAEAQRRARLSDLSTSTEERETFAASALAAKAALEAAMAGLAQARVNMERTELHSPVNGWITNLLTRQGDYAVTGQRAISVVDADSFWVDGYFEETALARIHPGDPAKVWLMGYRTVLHGHVQSIARGIGVNNAEPNGVGLASVNPIFTWVRLAQRVPVRIHLDSVPDDVRLVQGLTASVEVDPVPPDERRIPPAIPPAPAPVGPTP